MKKRYVLNIGENQHSAVVARKGMETAVRLGDGEMTPVNYRPVLAGKAISLRFGGKIHLVHLTGLDSKGNVVATINGRPVNLTVMDELKAQALDSLAATVGNGSICADIPGLVVEIKVKPGQVVHQGEPVIVVEAMKMQNELVATVGGTVMEIPVAEGQAVNPGDVLVVIEPEAGG